MKKVLFTRKTKQGHWVGDGFPVRTIFSYNDIAKDISPFLLMDYAGPMDFPPNEKAARKGVGSHPHRGFETVTIVYEGEVEHRDSSGGGGVIESGDVQWMTAASGLVHEERHGRNFSKNGGRFEMVQLWVNLPKKDKMTSPRYQGLKKSEMGFRELPKGQGSVTVIAGQYEDVKGPAQTFSPINLWDLRLKKGAEIEVKVPEGQTAMVFLLSGKAKVGGTQDLEEAEMAVLEPKGDSFSLTVSEDSKILFLGGEPLNEPVFGYGPFVMSNRQEILEAMQDLEAGKMGTIEPIEGSNF